MTLQTESSAALAKSQGGRAALQGLRDFSSSAVTSFLMVASQVRLVERSSCHSKSSGRRIRSPHARIGPQDSGLVWNRNNALRFSGHAKSANHLASITAPLLLMHSGKTSEIPLAERFISLCAAMRKRKFTSPTGTSSQEVELCETPGWGNFDSVCQVLNEGVVTENGRLIVPTSYKD